MEMDVEDALAWLESVASLMQMSPASTAIKQEIERLRKIVRMVAESEYVSDDWGYTGLDMGIKEYDIAAFDAVRDEARSLVEGK